jgi:hypothetical protein
VVSPPYLASEDADTMDGIFRDEEAKLERMMIFATNGYAWLILSIKLSFLGGFIMVKV